MPRECDGSARPSTRVEAAFEAFRTTIPKGKRFREVAYDVKDVVGRTGFGIGSAGLPGVQRADRGPRPGARERHRAGDEAGQRRGAEPRRRRRARCATTSSTTATAPRCRQRALQAHADPLLGYTEIDGTGFVVADSRRTRPTSTGPSSPNPTSSAGSSSSSAGRTPKVHCVCDADSDQALVEFQTEDAIADRSATAATSSSRHHRLRDRVRRAARDDHRLFVEAFREDRIPGVSSA